MEDGDAFKPSEEVSIAVEATDTAGSVTHVD